MTGRFRPEPISTRLKRIAKISRERPEMRWTTLGHHLDSQLLGMAFARLKRSRAAGVDGQSVEQFGKHLARNLARLEKELKSGNYKAPPVRRVEIPKEGKRTRPIGIPTVEDAVAQGAVSIVLNAVYEQDFLDCSYGFRPGRSAHQVLQRLWLELTKRKGGYVLDLDIKGFFDNLDHEHLRTFLGQRVGDGIIQRLVGKWLKAGVMVDGRRVTQEKGSPQGGTISPILANLYLHEVLDKWAIGEVKPRMRGEFVWLRYADDAVGVFTERSDAERVMRVLPKRLGKYGLELHAEKTRLLPFRRPDLSGPDSQPGTFDLLGFSHFWGKSRTGKWTIQRKTAKKRFTRSLKAVAVWCKENRHLPVKLQYSNLSSKLLGHYGYYGLTGNYRALARYRYTVERIWMKWLGRRSQMARRGRWTRFKKVVNKFPLPPPRIVHSPYHHQANALF